jgi:hypothetical protein
MQSKPRTIMLHGVKCGFTTSVGKLAFDDVERVARLIKSVYGELAIETAGSSVARLRAKMAIQVPEIRFGLERNAS